MQHNRSLAAHPNVHEFRETTESANTEVTAKEFS
jgi:hypothetical protein